MPVLQLTFSVCFIPHAEMRVINEDATGGGVEENRKTYYHLWMTECVSNRNVVHHFTHLVSRQEHECSTSLFTGSKTPNVGFKN